jgi:hypothetical protein
MLWTHLGHFIIGEYNSIGNYEYFVKTKHQDN